jgi:hypothetical protein
MQMTPLSMHSKRSKRAKSRPNARDGEENFEGKKKLICNKGNNKGKAFGK